MQNNKTYTQRMREVFEDLGLDPSSYALELVEEADAEIQQLKNDLDDAKRCPGCDALQGNVCHCDDDGQLQSRKTEVAKTVLNSFGYCVSSLWHVDDVKQYAPDLTNEQAMEILDGEVGENADHSNANNSLYDKTYDFCEQNEIKFIGYEDEEEENNPDFDEDHRDVPDWDDVQRSDADPGL